MPRWEKLKGGRGPRTLPPGTNHNEIVLPVGLKHLVKPERLRPDSAQHGPEAEEGKSAWPGTLGAHVGQSHPPSAPRAVAPPPRAFSQDGPPRPRPRPPRRPASVSTATRATGLFFPCPSASHHWRSRLVVSCVLRDWKVF